MVPLSTEQKSLALPQFFILSQKAKASSDQTLDEWEPARLRLKVSLYLGTHPLDPEEVSANELFPRRSPRPDAWLPSSLIHFHPG